MKPVRERILTALSSPHRCSGFPSLRERKVTGWIAKDVAYDYLAYAFLPSARCSVLPFQQLWLCWQKYRHEWGRDMAHPSKRSMRVL